MMMELTFNAASGAVRRTTVTPRADERPSRAVRAPIAPRPPDEIPEIGRGLDPAQGWRAANRGLQRAEAVFAALLFAGLLALGTLTFGYALDGMTAAHAAGVPAAATSQ